MFGLSGLIAAPRAEAAGDGPYAFPNSSIAGRAEAYADGSYGGQCLVFVANMIKAAGGPAFSFGFDTNTYQSQWAKRATPVPSIAEAQRGDIIQWGGGVGGTLDPHTGILTSAGANPQVIDSNYGTSERVSRGSLASRMPKGAVYRIWRVGRSSSSASGGGTASLARNKDGRLELFAVGLAGEVFHRWQVSPGGTWSSWARLDGTVSSMAAETNADGRIELFAVGTAGDVYRRAQVSPGGNWSGWQRLDGTVKAQ
jgi:hypothetical protein